MKNPVIFTQSDSEEMMKFEEDITYFYGAKDTRLIADNYLKALCELEKLGIQTEVGALEEAMIPHLRAAYREVENQTPLKFNIERAARHEFKLIMAQSLEASFEKIYQIMVDLYSEVFGSNDYGIHKAASLRTFLYKYKISLLRNEGGLTPNDCTLILSLARSSEQELSQLHSL
ncbi:MAG: hypothetical protein K2Y18_07095 [Alphaproteobacteria bacterium]|jgi:hypothetical protein|nr:hypothetical protein [Alphaproteobacteria bacterium]